MKDDKQVQKEQLENEEINVVLTDEQIEEEINSLIDVSDDEILESLQKAQNEEKKSGRKKLATTVKAETLISNFLNDKTDENWQAIQEFFWYGIKQYAKKYVGDKNYDDAYDMTIETFINAYNNIHTYDPNKAKFSTWLWTICRNNCLGFIKRNARINTVNNDLSEIYDSELTKAAYTQNNSEFENGTFKNNGSFETNNFSEITKALYDVSIKEMTNISGIGGQILHMKLIEDKKIREIAVELSMNESTVKNYLYRGKQNLKRILSINHKDLVDVYKDMSDASDLNLQLL